MESNLSGRDLISHGAMYSSGVILDSRITSLERYCRRNFQWNNRERNVVLTGHFEERLKKQRRCDCIVKEKGGGAGYLLTRTRKRKRGRVGHEFCR